MFFAFKVYTLFHVKQFSNLFPPLIITHLKHVQEVYTRHDTLYLCYFIPPCKIQSWPYCWYTNTYLTHPPAPTQSMLSTNHKSTNSQGVRTKLLCFPTLNGGKGVCEGQRLMTVIVVFLLFLLFFVFFFCH